MASPRPGPGHGPGHGLSPLSPWPGHWALALGLACLACLACLSPRCEATGLASGQHATHARERHDAGVAPLPPPQQPQPAPLQQVKPDKNLLQSKRAAMSPALGPRLRRQLRYAEAPADEDDADELGAAERWLPGGGGRGAAARALGIDDFPPPPPHPKHLLYNAVLPSPPWRKRDGRDHGHHSNAFDDFGSDLGADLGLDDLAGHHMLRTIRGNRQYDIPQIECPPANDGMDRFACPSPDDFGRYRCIDDHVLCDGFVDCPGGEDEARMPCMFYKTVKAHLDLVADALLRWARGR